MRNVTVIVLIVDASWNSYENTGFEPEEIEEIKEKITPKNQMKYCCMQVQDMNAESAVTNCP